LLAAAVTPAYSNLKDGHEQYASFPRPLETYPAPSESLWDTIVTRASMDPFNVAATVIFILAIIHTFLAGPINKLAHKYEHCHEEKLKARGLLDMNDPDAVPPVCFKATLLHFFGEVEAIFGIWVIALAGAATWFHS